MWSTSGVTARSFGDALGDADGARGDGLWVTRAGLCAGASKHGVLRAESGGGAGAVAPGPQDARGTTSMVIGHDTSACNRAVTEC